jgi:hypothetical protein
MRSQCFFLLQNLREREIDKAREM